MMIVLEELSKYLGGVILFEETVDQKTADGIPFIKILQDAGIMCGIKLDKVNCDGEGWLD
jgi:fructose-bisphosphate aldolase class I